MDPFVAAMVVLVAALLVAEARSSRLGIYVVKPMASAVFVAAALSRGAAASGYGRAVLAGLGLSFVGDVLLMPPGPLYFTLGLASFLLAHVAYGAAFLVAGADLSTAAVTISGLTVVAAFVGRWLLPHVPPKLQIPVLAYMTVITGMVALSTGAWAQSGRALFAVAALAFYLSDLSVARDRFVAPGFGNRVWGLPLYYGAQLLFVATLGR